MCNCAGSSCPYCHEGVVQYVQGVAICDYCGAVIREVNHEAC
jgi:transcription initiation factor TFIIIB Brf1 subunit/transcription initiation factor TFIIB